MQLVRALVPRAQTIDREDQCTPDLRPLAGGRYDISPHYINNLLKLLIFFEFVLQNCIRSKIIAGLDTISRRHARLLPSASGVAMFRLGIDPYRGA